MRNSKKVSILASLLLVIGIVGSLITFQSSFQSDEIAEEKVIHEELTDIDISTDNATVNILPTNEPTTTVEISGNLRKSAAYQLSTDVDDSILSIHVDHKRQKLFNFFPSSLTLTVYVPEKIYDSLHIDSDNGHISVDHLQANDLQIETDNGKVELSNITGDTVTTKTSNGSSELKNVIAQIVDVQSDNGKINLIHVDGTILGKANNGGISLETKDLDRAIELETDNGRINIQTEKEPTNATINAFVDNGKVDIFGDKAHHTVIGNGDHLIQLTSNNGNITVEEQ